MATTGSDLLQGLNNILDSKEKDRDRDRDFSRDIFKMQIQKHTNEQNTLIELNFNKMERLKAEIDAKNAAIENLRTGDAFSRYALEDIEKSGKYSSGNGQSILGNVNAPILEQLQTEISMLQEDLSNQNSKYINTVKNSNTYRAMGEAVMNTSTKAFDGDPSTVSRDDLMIALSHEFEKEGIGEYDNSIFKPSERAFKSIANLIVTDNAVQVANKSMLDYEAGYGDIALIEKDLEGLAKNLNNITGQVASELSPVVNQLLTAATIYSDTLERKDYNEEDDLEAANKLLRDTKLLTMTQFLPDGFYEGAGAEGQASLNSILLAASNQLLKGYNSWESSKDNRTGVNFNGIMQATETLISLMSTGMSEKEALQVNEDIYNQLGFMGLKGFNKVKEAISFYDNYTSELMSKRVSKISGFEYKSGEASVFSIDTNFNYRPTEEEDADDTSNITKVGSNEEGEVEVGSEDESESSWWDWLLGKPKDTTDDAFDFKKIKVPEGLYSGYGLNSSIADGGAASFPESLNLPVVNSAIKDDVEDFGDNIKIAVNNALESLKDKGSNIIKGIKKENLRIEKESIKRRFLPKAKHITEYPDLSSLSDRYIELSLIREDLGIRNRLDKGSDRDLDAFYSKLAKEKWYLAAKFFDFSLPPNIREYNIFEDKGIESIKEAYDLFLKSAGDADIKYLDEMLISIFRDAPSKYDNLSVPEKLHYLKKRTKSAGVLENE